MSREPANNQKSDQLGDFLKSVRNAKRMTLRQVEEVSDQEISNAYLSQLENNKIAKPSPNILHKLSDVYGISYESLMSRAGYIATQKKRTEGEKHGKAATFAGEHLTGEEEDELLKYLAFLRSKRGR